MTEAKITAWEILNHGMDHEQYFQGCGVSHTDYTDIATGIGDDAREAYEDALEQLACAGWDVSRLPTRPRGINAKDRVPASVHREMGEDCDAHIYVSVRVRGPKARARKQPEPETAEQAMARERYVPGVYRWDGRKLVMLSAGAWGQNAG